MSECLNWEPLDSRYFRCERFEIFAALRPHWTSLWILFSMAASAADALLDCVLIDLLGCALPRASTAGRDGADALKFDPTVAFVPRKRYSAFDLLAGAGTNFLINLGITAVVPMALSSAESRGHLDPLMGSGSVIGATSIGMLVSVIGFYFWPEPLIDGKAPFFLCAALLLLGNGVFLLAELHHWSLDVLLGARAFMALGFGAGFAAKRRAGLEADPQQREHHFLMLELFNTLGMASGPIVAGSLAVMLPTYARFIPPILMGALSILFLAALVATPLDSPLAAAAPRLADESTPLVRASVAGSKGSAMAADPSTMVIADTRGAVVGSVPSAAEAAIAAASSASSDAGSGMAASSLAPPSLFTSAIVQISMLLFGVSRCFLKFGFESAMVVVYDRQFFYSPGVSGVIAGACALSTVFSLVLYQVYCAPHVGTHRLLLIAEVAGLASAALMIATEYTLLGGAAGVPLAVASGFSHEDFMEMMRPAELLTLGASMLFYPAMYLGAAIGNSHPLRFARPGHPLLSRRSMLAQQEILQKTVGKGLGMVWCRMALGDPPHLAALGRVFFGIMAAQVVLLVLCFDPRETRARMLAPLARWRRAARGLRDRLGPSRMPGGPSNLLGR